MPKHFDIQKKNPHHFRYGYIFYTIFGHEKGPILCISHIIEPSLRRRRDLNPRASYPGLLP